MYHEAGDAFWEAALKDFPTLPHLTRVEIIYNYRTHKAFNTSCWSRFNTILSDRAILPRLEVVDVCPTIRSQRMGYYSLSPIRAALSTVRSSGRLLTHWQHERKTVFALG